MNVKAHVKDISQIVWGTIWFSGRSNLVIIEREKDIEIYRGIIYQRTREGPYSNLRTWSYLPAR